MNLMHALHALLGNHQQQQNMAKAGGGIGQGLPADLTFNPNPQSNIPHSSHNLRDVMNANGQLQQTQGQGIPLQPPGMPNLGNTAGMGMQRSLQGGGFNPGLSPLQAQQSAGGGPRGVQPVAPAYGNNLTGIPQDLYNPQVQDNGYFWDSI